MSPLHAFGVLRLLNDGQVHTQQAIAKTTGYSPETVLEIIHVIANDYRVALHTPTKHCYQLIQPLQWLDEATVYQHLTPSARQTFTLSFVDEVDSTNTRLLSMADHTAQHGLVLGAEWQRAGRGRMQRKWQMALGGSLAFSTLWCFPCALSALSGITLATGIAVVRALRQHHIIAHLKWPNDIVLAQHKLGGILVEIAGQNTHTTPTIIGIGLNIANLDQWVPHATGIPTDCTLPARNVLMATLLNHLHTVLTVFSADGFAPFQTEWQTLCTHLHASVHLLSPNQKSITGIACGVNEQGALLLQTPDGIQTHHVGEITLRTQTPS